MTPYRVRPREGTPAEVVRLGQALADAIDVALTDDSPEARDRFEAARWALHATGHTLGGPTLLWEGDRGWEIVPRTIGL